jgi:hypothetical protein
MLIDGQAIESHRKVQKEVFNPAEQLREYRKLAGRGTRSGGQLVAV